MEIFSWWRRAWLLLLRSVFLETSDGVLSSISSILDSCQKKQIEYLATLREGIEHRKYRAVCAGVGMVLLLYTKFAYPVSQRCGPGEGMVRGWRSCCAGNPWNSPFPWERIDRWVKWEKSIGWNDYWYWLGYWCSNDMTHKAGIMDSSKAWLFLCYSAAFPLDSSYQKNKCKGIGIVWISLWYFLQHKMQDIPLITLHAGYCGQLWCLYSFIDT